RKIVEMAALNAALMVAQKLGDEARNVADLQSLRDSIGLNEVPSRIEAYDVSNIHGREAVASMVVFQDGMPAKSQYRRF
ncbi:MAG: excinuclease ABC subunit C, partial [Anaerolineae bacterium]|nr:excinuclease ABC subunit C [Anaerolineae bacterium]